MSNFRPCTVADTEAILQVWLRSTVQAHPFLPPSYWETQMGVVRDRYLPAADTQVWEEDGKVAGFISVLDGAFIGALFVDPDYQGQGIGRQLLQQVQMRNRALALAVYCENTRAVEFYKNYGFTILEERPNDDSGQPEYLMRWKRRGF